MSRLSLALAKTHEALYPRLETLTRQVEAIAARKPESGVPVETRAAAETLLFDTQRFGRSARRTLPPAPDSFGALATVLGQVLATLDAFETRHSAWSEEHKGFVWLLPRRELRPVARLRPHAAKLPAAATDTRHFERMKAEIIRRIDAKYDEGYDAGFAQRAKRSSVGTSEAKRP